MNGLPRRGLCDMCIFIRVGAWPASGCFQPGLSLQSLHSMQCWFTNLVLLLNSNKLRSLYYFVMPHGLVLGCKCELPFLFLAEAHVHLVTLITIAV